MKVETCPLTLNEVANHPVVLDNMGLANPLNFASVFADPRNVVLTEDGFCAMFLWSAPAVYECHIMALPGSRGSQAIASGKRMLDYMRGQGARMIWGQPSIYNKRAIWYIRHMGLASVGKGENAVVGPVEYFTKEDMQCPQQ